MKGKINKRYSRDLKAQLPMSKDRLPRMRYAILNDSTFTKNVPMLPDVMEMTPPLSTVSEMAEVLVAMFSSMR